MKNLVVMVGEAAPTITGVNLVIYQSIDFQETKIEGMHIACILNASSLLRLSSLELHFFINIPLMCNTKVAMAFLSND